MIGSTMGTSDELRDLLTFVANAGITPEIGLELPMDKAFDGFQAMVDGHTAGKIVFTR
jgi:D-arabinose 1-dehydrogenase-like Zn-dependent alcohol dehydrogenase